MVSGKGNPEATRRNSEGDNPEATRGTRRGRRITWMWKRGTQRKIRVTN